MRGWDGAAPKDGAVTICDCREEVPSSPLNCTRQVDELEMLLYKIKGKFEMRAMSDNVLGGGHGVHYLEPLTVAKDRSHENVLPHRPHLPQRRRVLGEEDVRTENQI